MKEYKITPEQCQKMIGENVCNGCGGKLEPLETVDNCDDPTFWSGCLKCSTFTWGTKEMVFKIAEQLVTKYHHVQYSHMGSKFGLEGDKLDYWNRSQISGTTGLVQQVLNIHKELQNETETPNPSDEHTEGEEASAAFTSQAFGAAADCELRFGYRPFEAWARGAAAVAIQTLFTL